MSDEIAVPESVARIREASEWLKTSTVADQYAIMLSAGCITKEQFDRGMKVFEAIERANAIVAEMPPWKRGILECSGQPTVSVPRRPLNKVDY